MSTNNEQSPLDADIALHEKHELEAMTPKKIWGVFWVLTAITSLEFFIALFLVPHHFVGATTKVYVYVALTLLKAFYIVAYFMHLKFERLNLIYCIVVPTVLIIALVTGLMSEGHHWLIIRDVFGR